MNRAPGLSVVVAVECARANLPDVVAALDPPAHPEIEFIFCHAASPPVARGGSAAGANVVELYGGAEALIPHLWRDGILAASGTWVATTTAHCIPATDWILRLEGHLGDSAAAIGGVVANDAGASAADWAVYLLRYVAFAAPQEPRPVTDIAADNALYRRALIVAHRDLLADGFWEPAFHARLRAAGHELRLDPALAVTLRNRYRVGEFFRQRLAHGRAFGRERAAAWSPARRVAMLLASPLLPLVFLRKIVRAARRHPMCSRHLVRASGWLVFFLGGWGTGEALGYWAALRGGSSR